MCADVRSVQGNILIDKNGIARLGDFGITGVITDPTVIDPGRTTSSQPGVVRYMAPELLNPTQFHLQNGNPTKESDVFSFAMTTYEVSSLYATCGHYLHRMFLTRSLLRYYRMGLLGMVSSSFTSSLAIGHPGQRTPDG